MGLFDNIMGRKNKPKKHGKRHYRDQVVDPAPGRGRGVKPELIRSSRTPESLEDLDDDNLLAWLYGATFVGGSHRKSSVPEVAEEVFGSMYFCVGDNAKHSVDGSTTQLADGPDRESESSGV